MNSGFNLRKVNSLCKKILSDEKNNYDSFIVILFRDTIVFISWTYFRKGG